MSQQSFAEKRGKKRFNWNVELSADFITKERWAYLHRIASSWVTCAVGNQCSVIPRVTSNPSPQQFGIPVDTELAELGMGFYDAIEEKDKKRALRLLSLIEDRSLVLITEIRSQNAKSN